MPLHRVQKLPPSPAVKPLTSTRYALMAAALAVGLAAGVGMFTFGYAKGSSYLTNDPAACANCHIMSEHFAAWQKGSHKSATCNDCHTPHNLVGKYVTKARNGFWHSFYFTTGRYPDPLRITERNRRVTEGTCRYCHQPIVDAIDARLSSLEESTPPSYVAYAGIALTPGGTSTRTAHDDARISCIRCHMYVGHFVR